MVSVTGDHLEDHGDEETILKNAPSPERNDIRAVIGYATERAHEPMGVRIR